MNNIEREQEGLQSLGHKTDYKMDYAPEVLETFVNKHQGNDYWVRFNCPEFTSLCPITGQPDFAEIRISYIPDIKMVESKSLKLYLFSFRNHGDFHEDCVNKIMKDLIMLWIPNTSKLPASSPRAAASPSSHTPTMAVRAPSTKNLPNNASPHTSRVRIRYTCVERNNIVINKLATFRVQETATLKVANYLNNSALCVTQARLFARCRTFL